MEEVVLVCPFYNWQAERGREREREGGGRERGGGGREGEREREKTYMYKMRGFAIVNKLANCW